MVGEIHDYVLACPICQTQKGSHLKLGRTLQPLDVRSKKWGTAVLDFITGLPRTRQRRDLFVVDKATKMVHLRPCSTQNSGSTQANCTRAK